jgi:hydrogenase-4 component A
MCALACPFGNILPGGTPVPGLEMNLGNYSFLNTPFQPDPMYLRELSYQEKLSLLRWDVGQKTVAVKCDLCYFRSEGPACVMACPHKALILINDGFTEIEQSLFDEIKKVAIVTSGEL